MHDCSLVKDSRRKREQHPLEETVAKTKIMGKSARRISSSKSSLFLIGQNRLGNWVVRDQRGLCGGIFVHRAQAIRFAMIETAIGRKR